MAAQNLQIQIIIELDTKIEGKVEMILTLEPELENPSTHFQKTQRLLVERQKFGGFRNKREGLVARRAELEAAAAASAGNDSE
jgi:hypothetical protein